MWLLTRRGPCSGIGLEGRVEIYPVRSKVPLFFSLSRLSSTRRFVYATATARKRCLGIVQEGEVCARCLESRTLWQLGPGAFCANHRLMTRGAVHQRTLAFYFRLTCIRIQIHLYADLGTCGSSSLSPLASLSTPRDMSSSRRSSHSSKQPARVQVYPAESAGRPGSQSFFEKSPAANVARSIYLKTYIGGTVMMVITIFAVLSIYWGALFRTPSHNLKGWVVVRPLFVSGFVRLLINFSGLRRWSGGAVSISGIGLEPGLGQSYMGGHPCLEISRWDRGPRTSSPPRGLMDSDFKCVSSLHSPVI
jgi:hypothetical protein